MKKKGRRRPPPPSSAASSEAAAMVADEHDCFRLTRSQHRALLLLRKHFAEKELENERLKEQLHVLKRRLNRRQVLRRLPSPQKKPSRKRPVTDEGDGDARKRPKLINGGDNGRDENGQGGGGGGGGHRATTENLLAVGDTSRTVIVPTFRHRRLDPMRATMRLNDEAVDDVVFCKRHEKLEKNERQLVRRDRIWQREEFYRQKLLKKPVKDSNDDAAALKITAIHVCKKLPRDVTKEQR